METIRLNLLGCVLVRERSRDGLHLVGVELEARRLSPDTLATGVEDGGLVDVTATD